MTEVVKEDAKFAHNTMMLWKDLLTRNEVFASTCNTTVPPNFAKDTTPNVDGMTENAYDDANIGCNDGLAGTAFWHPSVLELCS